MAHQSAWEKSKVHQWKGLKGTADGTYGNGTHVVQIVIDGGQIVSITEIEIAGQPVEVELDWGSMPIQSKTFTVTLDGVTAASKITVEQSGNIATGRVGNDAEWDSIIYCAKPGKGSFTITGYATGPIVGKRKAYYRVT